MHPAPTDTPPATIVTVADYQGLPDRTLLRITSSSDNWLLNPGTILCTHHNGTVTSPDFNGDPLTYQHLVHNNVTATIIATTSNHADTLTTAHQLLQQVDAYVERIYLGEPPGINEWEQWCDTYHRHFPAQTDTP